MTLQYPVDNINGPRSPRLVAPALPLVFPATTDDSILLVDATNGNMQVNLPPASEVSVLKITIQKTDVTANTVTLAPVLSDTILPAAPVLSAQFQSATLINDAVSTWNVISTQP